MSLVFIGPPAAGKSRAGKRLARRLNASFADTDKLFVRDHGPIPEFIPRHGEPEFRRLEREVVAAALKKYEVVSLGGGAILDEATQADLSSDEHVVVLLVANPKAIEERISNNRKRPLLTGIDSWIETYERRKPIYNRLANVTVDTSFRPMWQVVNEVRRYLKRVKSPLLNPDRGSVTATPASGGGTHPDTGAVSRPNNRQRTTEPKPGPPPSTNSVTNPRGTRSQRAHQHGANPRGAQTGNRDTTNRNDTNRNDTNKERT